MQNKRRTAVLASSVVYLHTHLHTHIHAHTIRISRGLTRETPKKTGYFILGDMEDFERGDRKRLNNGMNPNVRALSSFGSSLFVSLCEDEPTDAVVAISPISVISALALAWAGVTPNSKSDIELKKALGVDNHNKIASLLANFDAGTTPSSTGSVQLEVASSVWTRSPLQESYTSAVNTAHKASVHTLGESYNELNAWVKERTKGRIEEMLTGTPSVFLSALLVNAVYFKGQWTSKFDEKHTKKGVFSSHDGIELAMFMHRQVHRQLVAHCGEIVNDLIKPHATYFFS